MKRGNEGVVWDTTIIARSPRPIQCEQTGEFAILQLPSGARFGLGDIGQRVWALLATPHRGSEIASMIAREYHVDPSLCEPDIHALLNELYAHHLITPQSAPSRADGPAK